MIRILIAEDEPPIARAVSRMIEELSPTFQVVSCVSNGQDALEWMRRDPVDVVFTDIRMPVMDGLELLKALRTGWPDCLPVIISGHQDFAYLQTAIRLGAFDYLLKPISREKLREMLDRLEDVHARHLLREAVANWRAGGEAPAAGISLSKELSYALILAIAGHWPTIADDTLSPGAVFWQMNDPEQLLRDLCGQAHGAITFVGRAAAERVFILEGLLPEEVVSLAKDMFERLTKISALPKTLCAMPGSLRFSDVAFAIRTARKRVYAQIRLCGSALLFENADISFRVKLDTGTKLEPSMEPNPGVRSESSPESNPGMEPNLNAEPNPDAEQNLSLKTEPGDVSSAKVGSTTNIASFSLSAEALTEALYVRNEKQISAAVEATVDVAVMGNMTQIAFEHFLEAIIHDRRLSFQTKTLKGELSEAVLSATSAAGLKADLIQIFNQYVLGDSKVELKSRVEQIEQYLSVHYAEEISSETLSARFGFVPSYLSKVFRGQVGVSPTEYLAKRRMEKARELLDANPGLLIRDAAALVGYKDPYYFSKLFKKATGLWPTEYQEGVGREILE